MILGLLASPDFRARLQGNAERLDLIGRRKIIRLLVKEILLGTDAITLRHSIALTHSEPPAIGHGPPAAGSEPNPNARYLLCPRGDRLPLPCPCFAHEQSFAFDCSDPDPSLYQAEHSAVAHALLHHLHGVRPHNAIEVGADRHRRAGPRITE
jgi:hypothetical protein